MLSSTLYRVLVLGFVVVVQLLSFGCIEQTTPVSWPDQQRRESAFRAAEAGEPVLTGATVEEIIAGLPALAAPAEALFAPQALSLRPPTPAPEAPSAPAVREEKPLFSFPYNALLVGVSHSFADGANGPRARLMSAMDVHLGAFDFHVRALTQLDGRFEGLDENVTLYNRTRLGVSLADGPFRNIWLIADVEASADCGYIGSLYGFRYQNIPPKLLGDFNYVELAANEEKLRLSWHSEWYLNKRGMELDFTSKVEFPFRGHGGVCSYAEFYFFPFTLYENGGRVKIRPYVSWEVPLFVEHFEPRRSMVTTGLEIQF